MITLRRYDPLPAHHPLVTAGQQCPLCLTAFQAGDVTALWPTLPAGDEEHEKAMAGRAYTTEAAPVHADCVPEGMVEWEE